jgi:hypothetical protein
VIQGRSADSPDDLTRQILIDALLRGPATLSLSSTGGLLEAWLPL